jgi:hypothetical protein
MVSFRDPVAWLENSLSVVSCLYIICALKWSMNNAEWKRKITTHVYFLLVLSLLLIWAVYNIVLLGALEYVDLAYEPPSRTVVVTQTPLCSIIGAFRVAFVSSTDWLIFVIEMETFALVVFDGFRRVALPADGFPLPKRVFGYAAIVGMGTLAQVLTIGLVVGFGRNSKGCSWKITRPGGRPNDTELMTYYAYNFSLFFGIFAMQTYLVYFVWKHLGGRGSTMSLTAKRKRRRFAMKMMLFPLGLLLIWSPKFIRRVFPDIKILSDFKIHLDRLEGFLTAFLLVLVNSKLRLTAWTFTKAFAASTCDCFKRTGLCFRGRGLRKESFVSAPSSYDSEDTVDCLLGSKEYMLSDGDTDTVGVRLLESVDNISIVQNVE